MLVNLALLPIYIGLAIAVRDFIFKVFALPTPKLKSSAVYGGFLFLALWLFDFTKLSPPTFKPAEFKEFVIFSITIALSSYFLDIRPILKDRTPETE